ncbi:SMC4-like_protein [Hexamita inflata]|uniref:Structural maintenance of chromosomes protein n=1 Tax=Hexamita inflata TaxID=28002 RepID=A0AA86Q2J2_9EUKA|nr:SMC4-like protein [Hexamita inflata]
MMQSTLRISAIHLENFKSWYGKNTIKFDKQKFTAIVGSNGSGKSNIIDAILFVCGWQAKQLRSTKAIDLIHVSERTPEFAQVTLDFQNQDYGFSVSRSVTKLGVITNYLNGQRVSQEEVQSILIQNGLDVYHTRFLILQGEVESISQMKPVGDDLLDYMTTQQLNNLQILQTICDKINMGFDPFRYKEIINTLSIVLPDHQQSNYAKIQPIDDLIPVETGLLEFIETIVGTDSMIVPIAYQAAVVEFIQRVKNQLRQQLQTIIHLKDVLEEEKDTAVTQITTAFNDLRAQICGLMLIASQSRLGLGTISTQKAKLEEDTKQNQTQIDDLQKHLSGKQQLISQLQIDVDKQSQNSRQEEQKTKIIITQMQVDEQFKQSVFQEAKVLHEKRKACRNELNSLLKTDIENSPNYDNQIMQIQKIIEDKQIEIRTLGQIENKHQEQIQKIKERIADLEDLVKPITNKKNEYIQIYDKGTKQNNAKLQQFVDLSVKIAIGLVKINQILKSKDHSQRLNEELLNAKNNLLQLNDFDETQILQINKDIRIIQQEILNIDQMINSINQQKLQTTKQNTIVNVLQHQKQSGQIKGVYNRLGSLGQIEQQYNLAAIACFGYQLENIVCDNMDAVQKSIQIIREKQLGTASFIDLQQVSKRYEKTDQQIDINFIRDNGGQLFLDLVQTDQKFKPAFWHVMGNTIICETSAQAFKINNNNGRSMKYRVVTYAGEIFEKGGSLTGGGIQDLLRRFTGFDAQQNNRNNYTCEEIQEFEVSRQSQISKLEQLERTKSQLDIKYQDYKICKQQIDQAQDNLQLYQQEQILNFQNLKLIVQNIVNIQDTDLIKQSNTKVSSMIYPELLKMYDILLKAQPNLTQLQEISQNIQEVANYYVSKKLVTEQSFYSSIQNQPLLDVLIVESELLNLIEFPRNFSENLGVNDLLILQQEIQQKEEEENQFTIQIQELHNSMNQFDDIKKYQSARKELIELNNELTELNDKKTNYQVQKQRFEPQQERLSNQITEISNKIEKFQEQYKEVNEKLIKMASKVQLQQKIFIQSQQVLFQLQQQLNSEKQLIQQLESNINTINTQFQDLQVTLQTQQNQINNYLTQITEAEAQIMLGVQHLSEYNQFLAKVDVQLEILQPLYNDHFDQAVLQEYDKQNAISFKHYQLKKKVQLNAYNPQSIMYNQIQILKEYQDRVGQLQSQQNIFNQVQKDYDQQLLLLNQLKNERKTNFLKSLDEINERLREIYRIFSMGGDALLECIDNLDPFLGLQYSVMPPKKSWRSIQNLSGGEKTLSSLSLIFALHQYKRNFIYIVDEIDAALDFRNVSLVANYMKELSLDCQFVIISQRNNTFEAADQLIGIYKINNASTHVTMDID